MGGAAATSRSSSPVRWVMNGGMGAPGFTSVWNAPTGSPARYFTAPISVMLHDVGEPPVVSRSTAQNVTSRRGVPGSSAVATASMG